MQNASRAYYCLQIAVLSQGLMSLYPRQTSNNDLKKCLKISYYYGHRDSSYCQRVSAGSVQSSGKHVPCCGKDCKATFQFIDLISAPSRHMRSP